MLNRKILLTILLLVFAVKLTFAQKIVYSDSLYLPTKQPRFCRNCTNYTHLYFGFQSFSNHIEPSIDVQPFNSRSTFWGLRYKYKLTNFFAIGSELFYNRNRFKIVQENKTFPDTNVYKKELAIVGSWGTSFYFRINFDKRRGNYIGHFLDMGINGNLNTSRIHKIKYNQPDGSLKKEKIKRWSYIENYQYSVFVRLGLNRFSFIARYRPSNLFKSALTETDLPKLSLGVELGFHL